MANLMFKKQIKVDESRFKNGYKVTNLS